MEALFYLGSIVIANLLVMNFGIIEVVGLTFPPEQRRWASLSRPETWCRGVTANGAAGSGCWPPLRSRRSSRNFGAGQRSAPSWLPKASTGRCSRLRRCLRGRAIFSNIIGTRSGFGGLRLPGVRAGLGCHVGSNAGQAGQQPFDRLFGQDTFRIQSLNRQCFKARLSDRCVRLPARTGPGQRGRSMLSVPFFVTAAQATMCIGAGSRRRLVAVGQGADRNREGRSSGSSAAAPGNCRRPGRPTLAGGLARIAARPAGCDAAAPRRCSRRTPRACQRDSGSRVSRPASCRSNVSARSTGAPMSDRSASRFRQVVGYHGRRIGD